MVTADANQNRVTIVHHSFLFLVCSLASLTSTLLSFRALYSIHPPKPRPPSSTSLINFCIHYLFQQSFIIHPLHMRTISKHYIHVYCSCQFSPHTCSRSHYFIPNPIQPRYTNHTPQTFHLNTFLARSSEKCSIYDVKISYT